MCGSCRFVWFMRESETFQVRAIASACVRVWVCLLLCVLLGVVMCVCVFVCAPVWLCMT